MRCSIGSGVGVGGIVSAVGAGSTVDSRTGAEVATAESSDETAEVGGSLPGASVVAEQPRPAIRQAIRPTTVPADRDMRITLEEDDSRLFPNSVHMTYSWDSDTNVAEENPMNEARPTMSKRLGVLALSVAMLLTFLTLGAAAPEADAYNPCPNYSIQDVFDDPNGNWDGDLVNNSDELLNGLNPCHLDTQNFCGGGGNVLCHYPPTTYVYYGYTYTHHDPCAKAIADSPNGDYDGDGVSNSIEVANGANACSKPCPHPTTADLAVDPNGDWDGDGFTNAIEVNQGTNPCSHYYYNPCPSYTYHQVNTMPNHDWDNDGIKNAEEVRLGYNPCQYNTRPNPTPQRLPHVQVAPQTSTTHTHTYTHTHRLPHVVRTHVPAVPVCPANYPYLHPTTHKCHANPVRSQFAGF